MSNKIYQKVADQIIKELESGTAPWIRPWTATAANNGDIPHNAVSGRCYSGSNILLLWIVGSRFAANSWLTFKQAKAAGGNVRKGERGAFVTYLGSHTKKAADDEDDETYRFLKAYYVFNVEQCDGLPDRYYIKPAPIPEPEGIANADAFLATIGADIRHGGDRAFYRQSADFIQMPARGDFKTVPDYYATSLHEHVHWTGHGKRLDRQFGQRFGDRAYAAEELVAELGAAFLCAHLGIEGKLQHANYVASWIDMLKSDNRAIFTAASKATQAADYLRAFSAQAGELAA